MHTTWLRSGVSSLFAKNSRKTIASIAERGEIDTPMREFEEFFTKARACPAQRIEFLRILHECAAEREQLASYIKGIIYETSIPQECINFGRLPLMRTDTPLLARFHHPGSCSVVRVWPRAFDDSVHENIDEFLSTLYDHEGWHAKEYHDCPETVVEYMPLEHIQRSTDLQRLANYFLPKQTRENKPLEIQSELRAYDRQLLMIRDGHRRIRDSFVRTIECARQAFLDWINQCISAA